MFFFSDASCTYISDSDIHVPLRLRGNARLQTSCLSWPAETEPAILTREQTNMIIFFSVLKYT
jgi:hypothetical protein